VGVRHGAPDRAPEPSRAELPRTGSAQRAAEPAGRRARRRREAKGAQLPYLVVLAIAAGGVAWISQGQQYVRGGTFAVAGALFVALLARLVLPERRAGMLASRRRFIDVTALAVLAIGLLVAGLVLPTPS
jgi:hypothetical protein